MIRFANTSDVDDIMKFIDLEWKKNHILGTNKNFFYYEHKIDDEVTYVISRDDNTNNINAILGYIAYGKNNRDVMLVMWKALHTANPTIGIDLLLYLKENGDVRIIASPGINKKTIGIYKYLGYETGVMEHWYRLNRDVEYKNALIENDEIPKTKENNIKLKKYDSWEDFQNDLYFTMNLIKENKPFKEEWYIKKRYFEHPAYKYDIYGYENESGKVETIFIFRVLASNNSNVLRFIDCIGNYKNIYHLTSFIDERLKYYNAEYIDLYEYGLSDNLLVESGWKKTRSTKNIIPNYFSPFEQKNIEINFCSSHKDVVLFKGDGDQDRPNKI